MPLLTSYDEQTLLSFCFGNRKIAETELSKAIKVYWPKRSNIVARKRIKSAIKIIRSLKEQNNDFYIRKFP